MADHSTASRATPASVRDDAERGAPGAIVRSVRRALAAATVFGLFAGIGALALPLYSMQVFDRVLSTRSVETLIALTAITLGLLGLQAWLDGLRGAVLRRGASRVGALLTGPLMRDCLRATVAGDPNAPGAIRDLREARASLASPSLGAVLDLPLTPIFVLVVALIHPLLGAFTAVAVVALAALAVAHGVAARRPIDVEETGAAAAGETVQDYVRNAEAIRGLGMEDDVARRWRAADVRLLAWEATLGARVGRVLALTKFSRAGVQVGITGLGASLVLEGAISPGAMIASSLLMARALAPLEQAVSGWRGLVGGFHASRRLLRRLRRMAQEAPAVPVVALPAPTGRLQVRGLVQRAPASSDHVLRGVSLDLGAGESLAVVGPSGSGKSTLMRVLAGVVAPDVGDVRLDGAALQQYGPALGRHLGYLPQSVQLLRGTVAENIARFQPSAPSEAVIAAARAAGVHDLVVGLPDGYATMIGEGGYRLSGGQQQRIGLARALYDDPPVIVLDEPNAHLDPEGEEALVEALAGLRARRRTVVLVSHRASLLRSVDWILVLRDGRVERAGARGELMRGLADAAATSTRQTALAGKAQTGGAA